MWQKQTTTATVSAVPPLRVIIRATYTAMISGSRKWPKRTRYDAAPDYEVWTDDEKTKWCLKEPEALYDFIRDECQG